MKYKHVIKRTCLQRRKPEGKEQNWEDPGTGPLTFYVSFSRSDSVNSGTGVSFETGVRQCLSNVRRSLFSRLHSCLSNTWLYSEESLVSVCLCVCMCFLINVYHELLTTAIAGVATGTLCNVCPGHRMWPESVNSCSLQYMCASMTFRSCRSVFKINSYTTISAYMY